MPQMANHTSTFIWLSRCAFQFSFYQGWCGIGTLPSNNQTFWICKLCDCEKTLYFIFALSETVPLSHAFGLYRSWSNIIIKQVIIVVSYLNQLPNLLSLWISFSFICLVKICLSPFKEKRKLILHSRYTWRDTGKKKKRVDHSNEKMREEAAWGGWLWWV